MRSWLVFGLLIAALAIPASAAAAYLNAGQRGSDDCKNTGGATVWHFVNNQYGSANPADARLFVQFDNVNFGPLVPNGSPGGGPAWNNGTIHWTLTTLSGHELVNAWTTLAGTTTQVAGKLQLSDCFKKT